MSDGRGSLGPLHKPAGFELSFRLREPVAAAARACVLLLHGVGGRETDLAELASGIEPQTLVVLPRGRLELGPGQHAWFRVRFSASGPSIDAAGAEDCRLVLIRFLEHVQAAYAIEPRRTVIAGFSQGGVMSAGVALSAPEHVAGFGLLSGRILPELEPRLAARDRLARLNAFIGHGEFDTKLPVSWADRADRLLTELGVAHTTRLYPVDHAVSAAMQADFTAWTAKVTGTA
jgi:phospholipase/carboxylesterase